MQQRFEQGYHFTYTFPGLQKVIQAAGRVIRIPEDTGYLWLMDDRYETPLIRSLLPEWWGVNC
jgi:DNA excision repair protein ERCC-2